MVLCALKVERINKSSQESKDPTLVKLLVQRGAWALEPDNAASSAVDLADTLDAPQCAPLALGNKQMYT